MPGPAHDPRGHADPCPDSALEDRVRRVLDGLTPDARAVMAQAGKRLCDQLAEQAQARRDLSEAAHDISAADRGAQVPSAMQTALRRATPTRAVQMPDGRWTTTPRADGPDKRALAQELGRDTVAELVRHLDQIDAEKAARAGIPEQASPRRHETEHAPERVPDDHLVQEMT